MNSYDQAVQPTDDHMHIPRLRDIFRREMPCKICGRMIKRKRILLFDMIIPVCLALLCFSFPFVQSGLNAYYDVQWGKLDDWLIFAYVVYLIVFMSLRLLPKPWPYVPVEEDVQKADDKTTEASN